MQSRKLLKEQLIYIRDKRNGEVKTDENNTCFSSPQVLPYTHSPSQTVEQTVRHIYQNYKSDATAPYFGETGGGR